MGVSHASAIVVGTIIGSGIFLVPAEMMQAVGSAWLVYVAWIVGGVLSLAGAVTYAELGAMKPQAGGEYIYIRDAYGPLPAFLYGWTWFAIAKPASIATLTIGLVRILGTFSALAFLNSTAIHAPIVVSYGQLCAIAAAALMTALNYVGIKRAGDFQVLFTLLKIVIIAAVALLAFTAASGTWRNFSTTFGGATGGVAGFMAALVAALWAYDGWNDLNMVSGEIKHPERAIPIALILGVGVVAALYMLTNAAVQYVLPASSIAASQRPASEATAIAVGAWGAAVVSAGMALSILVSLNGTIMSGARVPYAMARDGHFFRELADVHPRFHTPSVALMVQLRALGRAAVICRQFSAAVLAGNLCGVALLHGRGQYSVRPAKEGARRSAPLPHMGISRGSDVVRDRCRGAAVLHLLREHSQFRVGSCDDCRRSADLLVFCEKEEKKH